MALVSSSFALFSAMQDVTSYYHDMSAAAGGKIAGLRTPTLAVSSLDDPIMTAESAPIAELKNIEGLFILLTRCVQQFFRGLKFRRDRDWEHLVIGHALHGRERWRLR